jgi:hypothetical protein
MRADELVPERSCLGFDHDRTDPSYIAGDRCRQGKASLVALAGLKQNSTRADRSTLTTASAAIKMRCLTVVVST